MSSYQPFPIAEFKTGLYQYLEPWIRPQDAFEPLEDAYIYRGALYKRPGYRILGNDSSLSSGRMCYKDFIRVGTGATGSYTFTIASAPIIPGSLIVTAGLKTATDNGTGGFTGDVSSLGDIDYSTGIVTVNFDANIALTTQIFAEYKVSHYDYLSLGNGTVGPYTITTKTSPITQGTLIIYAGSLEVTDDSSGNLIGDGSGTVNYATGVITVTFNSTVASSAWIYCFYNSGYGKPIMGLKTWINPTNSTVKLLAFDTLRASLFDDSTELFTPINTGRLNDIKILENTTGAPVVKTFTINTGFTNLVPFSITMTDNPNSGSVTDDGATAFPTNGNFTPASSVDYANGVITLIYTNPNGAPEKTITINFTIGGSYFTGNQTNFINAVNWKPTTVSYLYLVNNVDRITLYNGTDNVLSRPAFPITLAAKIDYTNNITTAVDLDVFRNRLLVHRPLTTVSGDPENQSIRFSQQFNATNLVEDVVGNGGVTVFPTQDQIMVAEFLRDQMVVFFKNSTWILQPTGFANPVFRSIQVNSTRSTNCPYGAVPYDQRITSVGSKGIIACDGVNTQRFDVDIIDQFLEINPQAYNQCFSQRYDSVNQTWTLFPSLATTDAGSSAISDQVLVYNFLENTWSVYNIAMSCLGLYQVVGDVDWAYFAVGGSEPTTWEEAQFAWNSYLIQRGSPSLIGGGHTGTVYVMNESTTDVGVPYSCDIVSTLWNPFAKEGTAVDFGYIDIYYSVNTTATLNLSFYLNGENDSTVSRTITLSAAPGTSNSQLTNFQRVYLNFRAQFVQMEMESDTSSNGVFQIQGMILWAKPSGRITPGYSVL